MLILVHSLFALTSDKRSFEVQHFKFQGNTRVGEVSELKLDFKSFINGGTSVTLALPEGIHLSGENEKIRFSSHKEIVTANNIKSKSWLVIIEREGDYLIQAFVTSDSMKPGYVQTSAEQLYISFKKGGEI
jgi:hypothetical protein